MAESKFDEYCILELMGHRRMAGKVSEATLAGGVFLRIDVPDLVITKRRGGESIDLPRKGFTQYYRPEAVYALTPTSEAMARAVAEQSEPEPVQAWELRNLLPAGGGSTTVKDGDHILVSAACPKCGDPVATVDERLSICPNCQRWIEWQGSTPRLQERDNPAKDVDRGDPE